MTHLAIDTFHKERFGLVTGSRCTPLVPKRSAELGQVTLAKQLANEMYFEFYDEMTNNATEHGKMAEHFAHEHFKTYIDENIQHGGWYKQGDIGGNTDAEGKNYGVDYKCPVTLKKWLDYLYDGISDEEYNQCQLYLKLTDKDYWMIAAFLTETLFMSDNGLKYPVEEHKRMITIKVERDAAWNRKFDDNLPFVISKRNEYLEILKNTFGNTELK